MKLAIEYRSNVHMNHRLLSEEGLFFRNVEAVKGCNFGLMKFGLLQ
jgi:hypothetical protein